MKAAGKTVTPRRTEEARNTAEGFDDFVTQEKRSSLARIQFVNELKASPVSAAFQLLGAEPCDCCERRVITKDNCHSVPRQWFLPNAEKQTLTPVTDDDDERAVFLIAAVVCKDCNDDIATLQSMPDLRRKVAFLQMVVQALVPEEAAVPEVVTKAQRPKDTSTPTWTPVGPPPTPEDPPEPIVYKELPMWRTLTDEELIAIGPEAYEGRLYEGSAQWYEDWVYFMSQRKLIIEDDLFDEDFATFLCKDVSYDD